jgi:hypothetical protein
MGHRHFRCKPGGFAVGLFFGIYLVKNTDITGNIDTSLGGDAMKLRTKLKAGAAIAVPDFLSY